MVDRPLRFFSFSLSSSLSTMLRPLALLTMETKMIDEVVAMATVRPTTFPDHITIDYYDDDRQWEILTFRVG